MYSHQHHGKVFWTIIRWWLSDSSSISRTAWKVEFHWNDDDIFVVETVTSFEINLSFNSSRDDKAGYPPSFLFFYFFLFYFVNAWYRGGAWQPERYLRMHLLPEHSQIRWVLFMVVLKIMQVSGNINIMFFLPFIGLNCISGANPTESSELNLWRNFSNMIVSFCV